MTNKSCDNTIITTYFSQLNTSSHALNLSVSLQNYTNYIDILDIIARTCMKTSNWWD